MQHHSGDIVLSMVSRLFVFVAFTLTGLGATCLVEETNQKTLEHNSGEPQESFINGTSMILPFPFYSLNWT